jgi:phage FluMu gp28-like protein
MNLTPYQVELFNLTDSRLAPKRIINKGRQMGFTEIFQRINAYGGFHWYRGRKIINIAGTREKTAKEIQHRVRALFNNIENQIADNGTDLWFKLKNGTEYMALPSNPQSIRGLTKVGKIGVDEAAHFDLVDDTPVLDAIIPLAQTNGADLDIYSTPNGPRGFFYHLYTGDNDFLKKEYPIMAAIGTLYTASQVEKMLADPTIDVQQEYLCKFTTGRNSFFGDLFRQVEMEVEEY